MFSETKCKNKKNFSRYCLQCFSSESVLMEHKVICSSINRKHSVELKIGSIKFKMYFKQIALPFKIYAGFENLCWSLFKKLQTKDRDKNTSYTEKHQGHIPCSSAYKVICTDDKFSKTDVLYKGKNEVNMFIKVILEEYHYYKKMIKNHFKKKSCHVCRR